jgi:hypothetical protein
LNAKPASVSKTGLARSWPEVSTPGDQKALVRSSALKITVISDALTQMKSTGRIALEGQNETIQPCRGTFNSLVSPLHGMPACGTSIGPNAPRSMQCPLIGSRRKDRIAKKNSDCGSSEARLDIGFTLSVYMSRLHAVLVSDLHDADTSAARLTLESEQTCSDQKGGFCHATHRFSPSREHIRLPVMRFKKLDSIFW